jgi:transposase
MSTFFRQTAQAVIAKHIDRFPLLKLDQVIDWQPIEQYLNRQRTRYLRNHRDRPAYPLLSMFKAVLLGQWHRLSDPEIAIEFDSDPKRARASRQAALKDAATRKIWIAGAHMPFPGIGHIRAESNGSYTWVPVEYTPIEIDGKVQ